MYCEWIVDWFISHGIEREALLDSMDENFFEKEFIDSFAFIRLISDIEEHFNIVFNNDQFQDRDFSTIKGLGKHIEECVKEADCNE